MNPYIFISYNHSKEDKLFVQTFTQKLERAGIDYFIDKNIKFGDSIPDAVAKALNKASHVIAFLSPGAEKSQWVFFEIGIAFSHKKSIILRLVHSQMNIPSFLTNAKYISSDEDEDEFIDQIKPATKDTQNILEKYIEANVDFNKISYKNSDRFEEHYYCLHHAFDGEDTIYIFWNSKTKRLSKNLHYYGGVRWSESKSLGEEENRKVCEILKIPNATNILSKINYDD